MEFRLVRCTADGRPSEPIVELPESLVTNCLSTAVLYRRIGYVEPWVGYVAVDGPYGVGGGAFVGAPKDGCVEIAYYTLKEFEGRGYATKTVAGLIEIARQQDPQVTLKAFTLPKQNASTRILQRFGFTRFGDSFDVDAGAVWEWRT